MFFLYKSILIITSLVALIFGMNTACAQSRLSKASPNVDILQLEGKTLDSRDFQLASLKGKVTMVMFWSTDCPVCREKMPELRENIKGWSNKPFELVLVSLDKKVEDVEAYYSYLNQILPSKQRFTHLWAGHASYKDNIAVHNKYLKQRPLTYVIDKYGKVVNTYSGRIPAQVWDDISELL